MDAFHFSGSPPNATIRCFVLDISMNPGFVRNGTGNIDPSLLEMIQAL